VDIGGCGALSETLRVGDVFFAKALCEENRFSDRPRFKCFQLQHPLQPQDIKVSNSVRTGTLLSIEKVIADIELRRKISKDSGADAVCWEAGAIYSIAKLHSVPFSSIRVVSDIEGDNDKNKVIEEYRKNILQGMKILFNLVEQFL
jgi:nucleoside phosphorylase